MAQLQRRQADEDSLDAMKVTPGGLLQQSEWPTPTQPTTMSTAENQPHHDHHHTSHDDQDHHEKKSVVKKVRDKARKLKAALTKKKHGHDHDRGMHDQAGHVQEEDEDEDEEEEEEEEEEINPNLHGRSAESVEDVRKALSGLDTGGKGDILSKERIELVKDPEAPNSNTGAIWTPQGSNLGTGNYDPRAAAYAVPSQEETARRQQELPSVPGQQSAGVTPYLQSSNAGPEYKMQRSRDIFPAPDHTEKKLDKVDHIRTDDAVESLPVSTLGVDIGIQDLDVNPEKKLNGVQRNFHGRDELMEKAGRDSSDVADGASTAPNVTIPEGIMKPIESKKEAAKPLRDVAAGAPTDQNVISPERIMKPFKDEPMQEIPIHPFDELTGNTARRDDVLTKQEVGADVGIPSITHQAGEAMAKGTQSTLGLGNEENVGEEGKPITSKVMETIAGAKDRVIGSVGSVKDGLSTSQGHEEADRGKSWGEWVSEELKYAKDKLGGSILPHKEQHECLGESESWGLGTQEQRSVRNEKPENTPEEGHTAAFEVATSVVGKTIGIAQGVKGRTVTVLGVTTTVNPYEESVKEKELGFGGQDDVHEEKPERLTGEKYEGNATRLDHDMGFPVRKETNTVNKFFPTEEDRALSQVITDALSHGDAISAKDSAKGPYMEADSNAEEASEEIHGGKGIVDRVSGVVSSLLGKKHEEHEHSSPSIRPGNLERETKGGVEGAGVDAICYVRSV
eukprot:Gb_39325 [translate_table: standard]